MGYGVLKRCFGGMICKLQKNEGSLCRTWEIKHTTFCIQQAEKERHFCDKVQNHVINLKVLVIFFKASMSAKSIHICHAFTPFSTHFLRVAASFSVPKKAPNFWGRNTQHNDVLGTQFKLTPLRNVGGLKLVMEPFKDHFVI